MIDAEGGLSGYAQSEADVEREEVAREFTIRREERERAQSIALPIFRRLLDHLDTCGEPDGRLESDTISATVDLIREET